MGDQASVRPRPRLFEIPLGEIGARWFAGEAVPPPQVRAALASDPRSGAAALLDRADARLRRRRREHLHMTRLMRHERALSRRGARRIAGVDEAGMGPLAGPVVAAAVILPRDHRLTGLDDSKVLPATRREALFDRIIAAARAYGIGYADADEVDRINVYQAGLAAMTRAVAALSQTPDHLLVDARQLPAFPGPQLALVHGDALSASIAAASVLAKVTRDRLMDELDRRYPGYGFARNRGYGTAEHRAALRRLGPSPIHRKSFHLKEKALERGVS